MSSKKKTNKIREKINEIYEENELAGLIASKSRARSVTVGTAFGGIVELSMRGDYYSLWSVLQPVEVIELIEQLASGVGLQIAMRPRQDFASWRGWNIDADDRYWAGSAPWQMQQVMETHKKSLEGNTEEKKSLPEKTTSKKKSKSSDIKKQSEKVFEELKIQEEISDDLSRDSLKNIEKLREDIKKDRKKSEKEFVKERVIKSIENGKDPVEAWKGYEEHFS